MMLRKQFNFSLVMSHEQPISAPNQFQYAFGNPIIETMVPRTAKP